MTSVLANVTRFVTLFSEGFSLIEKVSIENYKCFRSLDVSLKPFNVLVGANNTGKSSFLESLSAATDFGKRIARKDEYFRFDSDRPPEIRLQIDGHELGPLRHAKALGGITRWSQDQLHLLSSILPIRYFDVPKLILRMESEGAASNTNVAEIVGNQGKELAALMDVMLRKNRKLFYRMIDLLTNLIPGLEDIDVDTPTSKFRSVNLVLDNGLEMPASLASMGVRLMIFFAAFAFHPSPPKLILIEEPETGVHPKRLADIVKLLRGISTGEMGQSPAQIVLTTHSPYLLDCVDLETDNVLVFQREDDGSRSATPVNKQRLQSYMDEYMLGEFWFNGGEDVLTGAEVGK